jgi:hypothetical protein
VGATSSAATSTRNGTLDGAFQQQVRPGWLGEQPFSRLGGRPSMPDATHGARSKEGLCWRSWNCNDAIFFLLAQAGRTFPLARSAATGSLPARGGPCLALTGRPAHNGNAFVDANMRELAATGFMKQ